MSHGGNVWFSGAPGQWLDYSANIRPGGAPEWVKAALKAGLENAAYYPDPEMGAARAAMAEYLGLDASMVPPTSGGISAIDMTTYLSRGAALTFSPCFEEYARQSLNRPLRVSALPLPRGREILSPALCAQERIEPGSLVYLCSPLNPVGAAFDRGEILALLEAVEAAEGYLVVDEAFVSYCAHRSVRDRIPHSGRLIVVGSMTKILGIPGVRLGYLCAQAPVIERLKRYQLTWELNCFAAQVALALPPHAPEIESYARENAENRAMLRLGLEQLGRFVYPSEASFLLTDLNRPAGPVVQWLKKRNILARQCLDFEGLNDGRHLRLAVKDESSNQILIHALKEAFACAENR